MNSDRDEEADYLATFGYKQELNRSLGRFSAFAAGFSFLSILTGATMLFGFGFGFGGPAFFWAMPVVFLGQFPVALCFAELASKYPLAGGVYQWVKNIASEGPGWLAGWILALAVIPFVAGPALSLQIVLPQLWSGFQVFGTAADAGSYATPGGARNAVLLGSVLVALTTIVNIVGIRLMAFLNNIGVFVELIGCVLLIVLLFGHTQRGPEVTLATNGTGAGHPAGYIGAFLVAGLFAVNILYGFDTAGTLAEETTNPRKFAPREIVRALTVSTLLGTLLVLAAEMAVPDIFGESTIQQISSLGLPYVLKSVLGDGLSTVFLACVVLSICVCTLTVQTGGIRLIFSMARDGKLPASHALSKVNPRTRSMPVPAIVLAVLVFGLLLLNLGNTQIITAVGGLAAVLVYLTYTIVTVSLLVARLRRKWPTPDHGPYFNMGRWGLPANLVAVAFQLFMIVNLAWPRPEIYGTGAWYLTWAGVLFSGVIVLGGGLYYLLAHRGPGKPVALPEHRAKTAASAESTTETPDLFIS